jgi:hypothetical protein
VQELALVIAGAHALILGFAAVAAAAGLYADSVQGAILALFIIGAGLNGAMDMLTFFHDGSSDQNLIDLPAKRKGFADTVLFCPKECKKHR